MHREKVREKIRLHRFPQFIFIYIEKDNNPNRNEFNLQNTNINSNVDGKMEFREFHLPYVFY